MAQLTGQAAIDYIKNNPNSGYKVLSGDPSRFVPNYQPQAPQENPGFLKSLAMAVTKPFRNLAGQGVETAYDFGRVAKGVLGLSPEDDSWMFTRQNKVAPDALLSNDEYRQFVEDPLGKGVQTAAGIGAYAVPGTLGAKGIGGMMKAGAVSGGLSGFSESDLNNPADVLTKTGAGIGIGTATAYGLGKLGQAYSKFRLGKGLNPDQKAVMEILDKTDDIARNTRTQVDPYNRALEIISGTTKGTEQKALLQSLANVVDPLDTEGGKVLTVLDSLYGVKPTATTPLTGAVIGGKIPGKFDIAATNPVDEVLAPNKLGTNMVKTGGDIEMKGITGIIGKPTPTQGGINMLKEAKNIGIDLTDVNKATSQADDIIRTKGGELTGVIDDLSSQGIGVPKSNVDDFFDDLVSKAKISKEKDLIKSIQEGYSRDFVADPVLDTIPLNKWNDIRQGVGTQAKFSNLSTPDEQTVAGINQRLYKFMQGQTDDVLKASGYNEMRAVNKQVSTAIDLKDFLKVQQNRGNINLPIGLMDTTAAVGGMAAGGPPGALAGMVTSKIAKSPKTLVGGGRFLAKIGQKVGGIKAMPLPLITQGTQETIRRVAAPSLTRLAMQEQPLTVETAMQDTTSIPTDMTGSQGDPLSNLKSQLVLELISTAKPGSKTPYSVSEAEQIADYQLLAQYGRTPKSAGKMTETGMKFNLASQGAAQALALLESGDAKTGKVANITSGFEKFFGTQSSANTAYRSKLALARTALRNAMLGANMTEGEMKSIEEFIPEYTDEPAIAKGKLETFIEMTKLYADNGTSATPVTADYGG